jgi:hypothetical protein
MGESKKSDAIWKSIAAGVVVALLAGGTAPWWWKEFFGTSISQRRNGRPGARDIVVAEKDFWVELGTPVSELRGRISVYKSKREVDAQVVVVHEKGPKKDSVLAESTKIRLYNPPDGYEICALELPSDAWQSQRGIDHTLGLKIHCAQGKLCSYTFPDETRVNVTLHKFKAMIAPDGACGQISSNS